MLCCEKQTVGSGVLRPVSAKPPLMGEELSV